MEACFEEAHRRRRESQEQPETQCCEIPEAWPCGKENQSLLVMFVEARQSQNHFLVRLVTISYLPAIVTDNSFLSRVQLHPK